jgi:AraC-like DNA-binding protein
MAVIYREQLPHCTLQDFVKCFWISEMSYEPGSIQDVMPDGCVELIFNFGSPYIPLADVPRPPLPVAFVVGLQNRAIRFRVEGMVKVVAARLFPWAALALLSEQFGPSTNAVRPLDADWEGLTSRLRALVSGARYDDSVGVLQEFLIQRALVHTYDRKVIEAAAKLLHQTKGQYRIEELAETCILSVRQLERGFQKVVGTSPKGYARTVRFDQAQRRLMFEPDIDLTRLALESGFSDQAHFTKDFKAFTGKTPGEYASEMRKFQEILRRDDVVFLQAGPPRP